MVNEMTKENKLTSKELEYVSYEFGKLRKCLNGFAIYYDMTQEDMDIVEFRFYSNEILGNIYSCANVLSGCHNENLKYELNSELLILMGLYNELVSEYMYLFKYIQDASQTDIEEYVDSLEKLYWELVTSVENCEIVINYHSWRKDGNHKSVKVSEIISTIRSMSINLQEELYPDDL